ncbi:protein-disulfide reductase DsbD domain-containing protein, partial [Phenylobacterium aquaticum]|uniref:protein-disulfide reductase DsbD domain-containing protein n=1 Tax=Phenylobacterium aquaticum TaxID=1763816 RepID=UPI0023517887
MMRFLARVVAILGLSLILTAPAAAQPVRHVQAELVADSRGITPGGTIHVALRQQIQKDWHTYWRNSGDSGEATRLDWTLPTGFTAGDIVWATPGRHPTGPLMNYGYQGEVLLPVAITAPKTAQPGTTVTLKATAAMLVCADVCVPEDADLSLTLPVTAGAPDPDATWGPKIAKALADAPKPGGLDAVFAVKPAGVALAVTGPALKGADLAGAYFYPYEGNLIDHAKPQAIERGPDGLTLALTPAYGFQAGRAPAALAGVLALGDKAYEISAKAGTPPAGASGLGPPPASAA